MSLDSCAVDITYYLMWRQKGSYYLKKFEYCNNFETIPLGQSNPLQFYLSHKRAINAEKIQLPTCYEYVQKGNKIDTFLRITTIDHSCSHNFSIHINGRSLVKQADIYQLNFARFDDGRKNIYYNYNQRTKFKSLIDMTASLIKQLYNEDASLISPPIQ